MKRSLIINILLVFISFVITFCFLEVIARVVLEKPSTIIIKDLNSVVVYGSHNNVLRHLQVMRGESMMVSTPTGKRLRRNASYLIINGNPLIRNFTIKINSQGYRYDMLKEKTDRDFRILVLGDSITFAENLPKEQTFPFIIESLLEEMPTEKLKGKNIQVINSGIGGIDLQNELAILMETGLSIEPDIVLVALYLNDATPSLSLNITRLPPFLSGSYILSFLAGRVDKLRAIYKYEWIDNNQKLSLKKKRETFRRTTTLTDKDWRTSNSGFNRMIYDALNDWGFAWSDTFWSKVSHLLGIMKSQSEASGFELAVVLLPVRYQVQSQLIRDLPQKRFTELMEELEIKHLDLLPALRGKYQSDVRNIYFDHCHMDAKGMVFIGNEITRFLIEEVI